MSWEGEQAGQADTRGEAEQHRHGQRQEGPSQEAADTQKNEVKMTLGTKALQNDGLRTPASGYQVNRPTDAQTGSKMGAI